MARGREPGVDDATLRRREGFKEVISRITIFSDKLKRPASVSLRDRVLRRGAKSDNDLVNFYWPEELCLATKSSIEEKPIGINTEKLIQETYSKLRGLLGEPDRKLSPREINSRIMFVDPEILMAFRYMSKEPDKDHEGYWRDPLKRIFTKLGFDKTLEIQMTSAVTYGNAGIVMVPNQHGEQGVEEIAYKRSHGVTSEKESQLEMRWVIAHEMVHFLYPDKMFNLPVLKEQIIDYIATEVYSDTRGLSVGHEWARASVGDYLHRLGMRSIKDLFATPVDSLRGREFFRKQMETHEKYFSDFPYVLYGIPETMLRRKGSTKFRPIPK